MIRSRLFALLFLAIGVGSAFSAKADADAFWESLDQLGTMDRAYAVEALASNFGNNPSLWPDWLDPKAVLIPEVRRQGDLLVVRQPLHAPCGQFGFTIFGPATAEGWRARLGGDFCAGNLEVVPTARRGLPELRFLEGQEKNPATGEWQRKDQHVRWTGQDWVLIKG